MEEENDEGYVTFVDGEDDEAEDDEAEDDEQEYEEYSNYSREDTVEAFRDYYKFLTTMFMDPARIEEPPEGGWPEITPATLQALGKTEEVCSLLRELPYIKQNVHRELQGSPSCPWANWNALAGDINKGSRAYDARKMTEDNLEEVPPHVIGFGNGPGDGDHFYLDTIDGNIYWLGCPDSIWRDPELACEMAVIDERDYPEIEREWRTSASAWWIPHFFQVLKDNFQRLRFIPSNKKRIYHARTIDPPTLVSMQVVFREHGWPDLENYRKQECIKALKIVLQALDESDE